MADQDHSEGRDDGTLVKGDKYINVRAIPTSRVMISLGRIANYGETVTILVGGSNNEEPEKFTVHKKLICESSYWFDKVFNGNFKENKGVINLPEENPTMFKLFIEWIYRARLPISNSQSYLISLVDLCIFADKIDMPILCNHAIDELRAVMLYHNIGFSMATVKKIAGNTLPQHKLRTLCYATWAWTAIQSCDKVPAEFCGEGECVRYGLRGEKYAELVGLLPTDPDLFADLLTRYTCDLQWAALGKAVDPRQMLARKLCEYHIHPPGSTCHLNPIIQPVTHFVRDIDESTKDI